MKLRLTLCLALVLGIQVVRSQSAPPRPANLKIVNAISSVSAIAGTPQSTTVNGVFATALRALVLDQGSNPIVGVTVTFTAPANGAGATFNGATIAVGVTDASGVAWAPTLRANGQPGSYVIAASAAGTGTPATFSLTNISASGGSGWTNQPVPVPVNTCDSTGMGSVVVDPVRPSDFYALVCQNGGAASAVLKSVDFGQTWANVNTSPASVMTGRPWGAAIDPNSSRNPSSPPTIYTPAGYGSLGLLKSTNGGVSWTQLFHQPTVFDPYSPFNLIPDVYSVSVLPDNPPNHIIITFHGYWRNSADAGIGESTDGGLTWTVHLPPAGIGQSHYMIIVDASTWLTIAQDSGGLDGVWKTSTAGRVGGVPSTAAWRRVDAHEHMHGAFQGYVDPANGTIYLPGFHGIRRSTDRGETWSWSYQTGSYATNLIATGSFIYSNYFYGPDLRRSARSDGTSFTTYTTVPAGMTTGSAPLGSAASFNGTNWVIVSSHQATGIWRYVE